MVLIYGKLLGDGKFRLPIDHDNAGETLDGVSHVQVMYAYRKGRYRLALIIPDKVSGVDTSGFNPLKAIKRWVHGLKGLREKL